MLSIPRHGRLRQHSLLSFICFLLFLTNVHALYESQAGVFDWHHTWIGKPHWAHSYDASRLLIATERNVLASMDSKSGAIVWRQVFEDPIQAIEATDSGIITAIKGTVQAWDATLGRVRWEYPVENAHEKIMLASWTNGDILVVSNDAVTRLSPSGEVKWSQKQEFSNIVAADVDHEMIRLVDATGTVFMTTILEAPSGQVQGTIKVSHSAVEQITACGKHLVWLEKGSLKWLELGTKKAQSTTLQSLVGLPEAAISCSDATITVSTDEKSVVVGIQDKALESIKQIPSRYVAVTKDGQAVATSDPTSLRIELGNDAVEHEHPSVLTGPATFLHQVESGFLVGTASGSMFMYDRNGKVWSREEALGHATASEFLELPEKQHWTQMVDELAEDETEQKTVHPMTRYMRRLQTHFAELQEIPQWLMARFTGAAKQEQKQLVSLLDAQSCWTGGGNVEPHRDNFGLRKMIITVTSTGKIVAQDTGRRGATVWARYFGNVVFDEIHVVRAASVKFPPLIVAIGHSGEPGYEEQHLYRLNAMTGADYVSSILTEYFEPELITGTRFAKVMRLPIEEPDERTHILALYEAGTTRVYIYPDSEGARKAFLAFKPEFYFAQRHSNDHSIRGYRVHEGYRGSLTAQPVWTLDLPADAKIVAQSRPVHGNVASLGRVLGNRNVLYKYLNPHFFAVLSSEQDRLVVRVVDAVKGAVLYEADHANVDTDQNEVHVIQAENWVVYHFWSDGPRAKGYQTVVLELYEGENENERVLGANFSSFDNVQPYVRSSAFMFPYQVRSMGVTTTRNGVSTKEILFALRHQIMGVNKRLLDPRRPIDKPSKEDQEEGLIPYGPIPEERQMFLSYHLEVAGIKHIVTTPALLESTSLVYCYGLDTFFTRSSPSKRFDVLSEDFSKSQLLLTIVGLVASIAVAGPMVQRKRINALWK
ncbi:hypothetical protein BCR43DRAFT_483607 [Syncephalastrum racemosum]|uniref:ER membrane protein complex subunit 1 n=1 Tax=Syncephalastrum racemosum TaxID=13706 RepID=A0A1X2HVN1_SYNRA|nr:hypothetical protein BCR43DRAFT_483607 [Syncephalastrum racemosum]